MTVHLLLMFYVVASIDHDLKNIITLIINYL